MTNVLIRIEKKPIEEICFSYATEDGVFLTDENKPAYIESVIADARSTDWVDVDGGYVYAFELVTHDADSDYIEQWLHNKPIHELYLDGLPEIKNLFGDNFCVLTVWDAQINGWQNWEGEWDAELNIELLGAVDVDKLHLAVADKAEATA